MTEYDEVPAAGPEEPPEEPSRTPPVAPDADGWQQLDVKMLIVGPLGAVRQMAVPAIIALVASGSQNILYSLFALPFVVLGVVALGVYPWLTVRYRVTDTQLQRRQGLLAKKVVTAPLDRVRSVDLEASLVHRVLGLTKVEVGTGVDDTRIELDSLSVRAADELRQFLLERSATAVAPAEAPVPDVADGADGEQPAPVEPPAPARQVLAEIDWSWLRFAPFNLAQLVIVAGALGVLSQFIDDLPIWSTGTAERSWEWITQQALVAVIGVAVVGCLVAWLVISISEYVVRWWNLELFREHGNLRLTAGLFTTRSTTLEEARVRGVVITEAVLLRMVDGATLQTLSTGVENGVTPVLPAAPRSVVRRVAADVLETEHPVTVALAGHGPLARRRCHVRHQWLTLIGTTGVTVATVLLEWSWWPPVATFLGLALLGVVLAEQQFRHLGHGLTDTHLVAGSGTTSRIRSALERDGIIGWVVQQSLFQRRVGLATLVATTAAGAEQVTVRDLPHPVAVALADAATPGMLTEFLAEPAG